MDGKLNVLFAEDVGSDFSHVDNSISQDGHWIRCAQYLLSILAEEDVAVQSLETLRKGLESTVAIWPSVLQTIVPHVIGFGHTLHPYVVAQVLLLVEVRRSQYLSQTFKRLVNILIQEACLYQDLFISVVYVSMILRIGIFINWNFKSIRAAHNFIIEHIIFIILGANIRQQILEHWNEDTMLLRQTLEICLYSDVADSIGWLIIPMAFDLVSDIGGSTIDEFNISGNVV